MKIIAAIICTIYLTACANQEYELALPTIVNAAERNFLSLDAIENNEVEISPSTNGNFEVRGLKEAPVMGVMCGGVYSVYPDPGIEVLKNTDLVLELKGVREVWVPLNGKPKKFYLFEVR